MEQPLNWEDIQESMVSWKPTGEDILRRKWSPMPETQVHN